MRVKISFFIYSINDPFVRLTTHHTKICHIIYIYFTILLFIYIFTIEFTTVKIFQWLCGKKIAKQEAGANH